MIYGYGLWLEMRRFFGGAGGAPGDVYVVNTYVAGCYV